MFENQIDLSTINIQRGDKAVKEEAKGTILNYLNALKETVISMNNFNYANHYLYYSMLRLSNQFGRENSNLTYPAIYCLNLNFQKIKESNQTLELLDDLVNKIQGDARSCESIKTTKMSEEEGTLRKAEPIQKCLKAKFQLRVIKRREEEGEKMNFGSLPNIHLGILLFN
jgi:hypothetical protein